MVAMWVKGRVKPEGRESFLKAIEVDALGSERDERDCFRFNVLQDQQDRNVYYLRGYRDEKALEAHRAAPHYAVRRAAADTLTARRKRREAILFSLRRRLLYRRRARSEGGLSTADSVVRCHQLADRGKVPRHTGLYRGADRNPDQQAGGTTLVILEQRIGDRLRRADESGRVPLRTCRDGEGCPQAGVMNLGLGSGRQESFRPDILALWLRSPAAICHHPVEDGPGAVPGSLFGIP
jgi:quinol monooxygenase YgiN